jgi:serine protease
MLRKLRLCLAATFLGMFVLPLAAQQQPKPEFVPGQLIVGFKSTQALDKAVDDLKETEKSGGLSARGARSSSVGIERLSDRSAKVSFDFRARSGRKLAKGAELEALEEYAKLLAKDPNVEYAHPNWVLQLRRGLIRDPVYLEDLPPDTRVQISSNAPGEPNDPVFRSGLLWHYLAPPNGMNALAAWSKAKGDRSIVVAVIDTGLLPDHPDIKGSGNVLEGYDFISDPVRKGDSAATGRNADPTDRGDACPPRLPSDSWHGSHVSGTIGVAGTNNEVGIAGVNWLVSVLPVRALGRCGGTIEDLAAAVRWSAGLAVPDAPRNEHKADIINLSLGIRLACTPQLVGALLDAIDAARKAGTTVVVAAGNEAVDIKGVTPAGCAGVISVAAADQRGYLTPYSNFGNVTIMAPGGDLRRDDDQDKRPDGIWSLVAPSQKHPAGVAAYEGTSMAAPHVAAAIALTLTAKPELRGKPDEIAALLTRSVAKRPNGACVKPCGPGLLDAKRMVEPEVFTSSK